MNRAKTTEAKLRQETYVFTGNEVSGNRDRDIYGSEDKVEFHLDYDPDGNPLAATICAPAYRVDEILVFDEDGVQMDAEQVEVLVYELLDDQLRFIERMTGLGVEELGEEPALV